MLTLAEQLDVALHHTAIYLLNDSVNARAFLRITGSDATRWLNGMVTNNIAALAPGEGNYNFLLNAQGRIQGDCTIYREPGDEAATFILATDAQQIESIHQMLDKFIIMDDVELTPAHGGEEGLLILGPEAAAALTLLTLPVLSGNRFVVTGTSERPVAITTTDIANCFELRADRDLLELFKKQLSFPGLSAESIEALRILAGRPRYGVDIRNSETARDLPQETAQEHALNFNKGCYLGQEIVERIHSRGQVHRTPTGFRLEGTLPALPAVLTATIDGIPKPMGELTSAARIPLAGGEVNLALGYIRRDALDRALPLTYDGGSAKPSALPFQL